jgi:hypothetical protein
MADKRNFTVRKYNSEYSANAKPTVTLSEQP